MGEEEPLWSPLELATELGITPRALRFYETKGLVTPRRDKWGRAYTSSDRDQLVRILGLKKLGFTLGEVFEVMSSSGGQLSPKMCTDRIADLERQRTEIDAALQELRAKLSSAPRQ